MAKARSGDTVRVHYTIKLDDGSIFETSADCGPLQFEIGRCEVLPGFEKALIGMIPGESKKIRIPADQAYGPYKEEKVKVLERDKFPEEMQPAAGMEFQIRQEGQVIVYRVTDISESSVTLDANHPAAGKDLTLDILLVEIL